MIPWTEMNIRRIRKLGVARLSDLQNMIKNKKFRGFFFAVMEGMTCMGSDNCCNRLGSCGLHEGNCYDDSDCSGDLICGDKNCFELWGYQMDFKEWSNCCQNPIPVDGGWSDDWEQNKMTSSSNSDCMENADGNWMMKCDQIL